ncbi:mRNA interferase YafO [compost metagenome]
MAVEVSYHPVTFAEFFRPVDTDFPGLTAKLLSDFESYIQSNRQSIPRYFGRDAPYTQPSEALQACLMHIHIKLPPGSFPQDRAQFYRVCQKGRPGEDAALVYVQGELEEDKYVILAFLWPDAHGQARDRDLMRYLARLAKQFRDEN